MQVYFFSSTPDDPYYCGLRARVPNFVNGNHPGNTTTNKKEKNNNAKASKKAAMGTTLSPPSPSRSTPNLQSLAQLPGAAHPFWWHSRLYPDSGMGGMLLSFIKADMAMFIFRRRASTKPSFPPSFSAASSPSAASGQSGYPPMAFRANGNAISFP